MKAFMQNRNAEDLYEIEIAGAAPDMIIEHTTTGKMIYYKRVYLRKYGDALYRPATVHHHYPATVSITPETKEIGGRPLHTITRR